MIHSFSARAAGLTAIWSDLEDEDEVILIDWDDVDPQDDGNLFHKDTFSKMEQNIRLEMERDDDRVSVITLSSGKTFRVQPLYDIIKLSKMEAKERKANGVE